MKNHSDTSMDCSDCGLECLETKTSSGDYTYWCIDCGKTYNSDGHTIGYPSEPERLNIEEKGVEEIVEDYPEYFSYETTGPITLTLPPSSPSLLSFMEYIEHLIRVTESEIHDIDTPVDVLSDKAREKKTYEEVYEMARSYYLMKVNE